MTGISGMTGVATGNVSPCRFVKIATSANGSITQANATDLIIGVSGPSTRNAPYPGLDDGYHAVAGESVNVFVAGQHTLIELAATLTPGALVKSNASSQAIASTTAGDIYGGILLEGGTSGKLVRMLVMPGFRA